jgi:integrase
MRPLTPDVMAVTTGLRQGELLGLKWEDVDLEAGSLQVRRILTTAKAALCYLPQRPKAAAAASSSLRRL